MCKIKIYPKDQAMRYLIIDVVSIVFLVSMVLGSSSDLSFIAKIIILLLVLIAFYFALWYRDWRLLVASFTGFLLITVLGIYEGSVMLVFGFMFADTIGRAKSKWTIASAMILIALMFIIVLWCETGELFKLTPPYLLPIMIIQLVFPLLIYFVEKTKNLQMELAEVNTQLVQQEERQRIARDLHDTIGHTLTMIKLKTELTSKLVDKDPDKVKDELNDILGTTRTALKQVRELVSDMNFISLEKELSHCKHLLESASILVEIKNKCSKLLLSSVEETMLSLCVREATTNILKHSQAKNCMIAIECTNNLYSIEIIDDGVGLENKGLGNGLSSIRERMINLQGTASFETNHTGGLVVALHLPIKRY